MKEKIRQELWFQADQAYGDFVRKLIPSLDPERIMGVRMPVLRQMAQRLGPSPDLGPFLEDLPHYYQEEAHLHGLILAQEKDWDQLLLGLEAFLPSLDNWALVDSFQPRLFKKHRQELLEEIKNWLASDHAYTQRFAIKMLMDHYLEEGFDPSLVDLVLGVTSDHYYVRMMVAWYLATLLAKHYDLGLAILEEGQLDPWVHKKTIQKAVESRRLSAGQKEEVKSYKKSPGVLKKDP